MVDMKENGIPDNALPINVSDITDEALATMGLSDTVIDEFKAVYEEAQYWERQFSKTTSGAETFFRKGSDGKMYEYVKQFHVIRELNKRYPGWTIVKWKVWYVPECRTWTFKGTLKVKYMTKHGLVVRKIPGVGGAFVHARSDDRTMPVQPDDMLKAARTDFIKNAAYWLGIATDVYEQEITEELYNQYQKDTASYGQRNIIDTITTSFETRGSFIQYCKTLPINEQAEKVSELLKDVEESKHTGIWQSFQKQNRISVERFIGDIEAFITKQKEKEHGEPKSHSEPATS